MRRAAASVARTERSASSARPSSNAYWAATSPWDGVVYEMEHSPFTTTDLPAELTSVQLQRMSGRQSEYAATGVTTSRGGYAVVFDTAGAIVHKLFCPACIPAANQITDTELCIRIDASPSPDIPPARLLLSHHNKKLAARLRKSEWLAR